MVYLQQSSKYLHNHRSHLRHSSIMVRRLTSLHVARLALTICFQGIIISLVVGAVTAVIGAIVAVIEAVFGAIAAVRCKITSLQEVTYWELMRATARCCTASWTYCAAGVAHLLGPARQRAGQPQRRGRARACLVVEEALGSDDGEGGWARELERE
ncbi:hypothetical protein C2E23DRAFT_529158 [Lenzites betulinus]|nr:hypothetical protein C2E23DRAFT_529158 [Lenzites betulinus]